VIQKIQQLLQKWQKDQAIDDDLQQRLMQRLRMEWNYHSNKIEGNTLSFGETKALLMFGITAGSKPLRHHIEMSGHNEAIVLLMDVIKEERPLTENFIRQLHSLILKEPYSVDAVTPNGKRTTKQVEVGRYKTQANHVRTKSGEIFRFASPEETPALMADLLAWYKKNSRVEGWEVIKLAAEFHYKFIRIHPFDDGNGRTVRILMNFILMKSGYPPVVISSDDKLAYLSALQKADMGDFKAFLDFIGDNVLRSLEKMLSILENKKLPESEEEADLSSSFIKKNIYLQEPESSYEISSIKSLKKILGITDNDIADWLLYKNDKAYRQSSAKKRIEHFMLKFYNVVKNSVTPDYN